MTKTQHPLPEYPRPALRRDSFESLNGLWQFAITKSAQLPRQWEGDILVPYSPETRASGVGRTLQPGEWLHYYRSFALPAGSGGRVLLHFGAVDYACAVQVNGHLVGGHRGGYWPFTFDITEALNADHNRLWVAVQDPTGAGVQARGKQTLRPGGMFYPAQSGIWQTVWLERVPDNYIETLTVTPDYDARTVTVRARTAKPGGAVNLWAVVRAGGVTIAEDWGSDEAERDGEVTLNIPEEHFFPWSPDSPFLYDLTVGTTQGEEVHRCIIHGLDDFPVQHAFLYLHREAQSQLLPELFGGRGGMVAVDAHGPEGLQAAAGEGGDMAIQKNAVVGGSFNDGEHPLIPGGDGVEIHDLAQSSHAGNIQQGLHLSGANIKTGILQTGSGGNGGCVYEFALNCT